MEVLLDSEITELAISLEFTRKQGFKLKRIEKSISVKNVDSFFNKERPIEHIVKVNIYYEEYRKRTEIDIISSQK